MKTITATVTAGLLLTQLTGCASINTFNTTATSTDGVSTITREVNIEPSVLGIPLPGVSTGKKNPQTLVCQVQ